MLMRTLRIHPFGTFPIYHTAVLAIVIILYVTSLVLTYHTSGILYLWMIFL